jgi:hypothetical protein
MFFLLIDEHIKFILYIFLGSQQKGLRAAPPPPSASANAPFNSNNNDHTQAVTLNPDTVTKFTNMMNQSDSLSSTSPIPPTPPRGVPATNPGGTVRRPPPPISDSTGNILAERRPNQVNSAALDYDYDFENRFRFTPIEHLPPPEPWKQLPSSKSVNAT